MGEMNQKKSGEELSALLLRGGIYQGVPGSTVREALTGLVGLLSLPPWLDRDLLLQASLEREALMPTAVGKGIALPHPRNPVTGDPEKQFAAIGFLRERVNWNSLDGEGVHTVILIVSASAKLHLHTLSRVNFFCQNGDFYRLLEDRAPREEITGFIRRAEAAWGD